MATKRNKGAAREPTERHTINVRLTPAEYRGVQAEILRIRNSGGIPVSDSAYAKHAVLSYPALRRIADRVRDVADADEGDSASAFAINLMQELTR